MYMNSILTFEERTLLQSLGCTDKKSAVIILNELMMAVPVKSEMFFATAALKEKLEHGYVDFAFEKNGDGMEAEEE